MTIKPDGSVRKDIKIAGYYYFQRGKSRAFKFSYPHRWYDSPNGNVIAKTIKNDLGIKIKICGNFHCLQCHTIDDANMILMHYGVK